MLSLGARMARLLQQAGGCERWPILISTAIQIMVCSPLVKIKLQFGICPGQPALEALTGRAFPAGGNWWALRILTATATRTTCFTRLAPVKPQSGICTTTFMLGVATVRLFRRAGA